MNARLSSLLVAGGVVLAGIQSGSLNGALPDAGTPASIATLLGASMQPGSNQVLKLSIPGFSGVPRLQVLAHPARVVVDLPGVSRGDKVTKKDVLGLACPQIIRSRVAQFSVSPQVTRVVLEVLPGTQAEVTSDTNGVCILLNPGQGSVRAQLGASSAPVVTPEAPVVVATLAQAEREHILKALRETGGRVGGKDGAAARLGLKRTTLQSRMGKLGINGRGV